MTRRHDIGESSHDFGEPGIREIYDGRRRLGYLAIGVTIRVILDDGAGGAGVELAGPHASIEDARRALVQAARAAESSS